MPLHKRESVHDELIDTVYADQALKAPLPSTHCPSAEMRPADVMQAITDELMLDGNSRMNLATFCQTWLEPEIHQLMSECIDKNMIDRDEYPQTAEIESRCVHMLAELWHSPAAANTIGCSTTGSSEACMLGGLAAKWRWRRAAEAGRQNARDAQHRVGCRAGLLAQVRPLFRGRRAAGATGQRSIHADAGRGFEACRRKHDCRGADAGPDDDLAIRAGGRHLPGARRAPEANRHHVPVHVDGASGGFIAPFIHPNVAWDFRLPRVKSVNTSGHKFGLSPLGVGWVIWRDAADLPQDLVFNVNYLGGQMPTFELNFSRPADRSLPSITTSCGWAATATVRSTTPPTPRAATWPRTFSTLGPFDLLASSSNPQTRDPRR